MPPYFFLIVLLAAVILLISLLNIDFALVVLIFSMLLSPEFNVGDSVPGRLVVVRFDDIFLFVVFLGWLAKMAINKELGLLRNTPINKPIIAYIFACLLATGIGAVLGTTNPKQGFFYILKYVEYFILYFMVTNNLRDKKQIKMFIFFMLFVSVIVGIYGLYSYFVEGLRATAPFEGEGGEANTLAGYLILIMSLTLGMFLYNRTALGRFLLGGLFVFLAVPFMFTLSRAGWLGFIPMLITFIIVSKKGKVLLLFCLFASVLIAPVFLPKPVTQRFHATFAADSSYTVMGRKVTLDESTAIRIRTWKRSFEQWLKRPVLGYGIPGGGAISDVQYTRILREVGIVGFLAFLWIIVRLFKAGFGSFNSPQTGDFAKGISLGFIAGLVGILTMGVGSEVFIIIRIMEPFWFLAAIVVSLPELSLNDSNTADLV